MAQSILFKNARLIDGFADQPRDGTSIVVNGERIIAVESGEVPEPVGAQVLDLKG
jgi:imidazolonepropionase-like amidohydrolase